MAEDDIARVLQNAEFEEILPESRNADGINVDKQQEYNIYCTSSNMNILSNSIFQLSIIKYTICL